MFVATCASMRCIHSLGSWVISGGEGLNSIKVFFHQC